MAICHFEISDFEIQHSNVYIYIYIYVCVCVSIGPTEMNPYTTKTQRHKDTKTQRYKDLAKNKKYKKTYYRKTQTHKFGWQHVIYPYTHT